MDQYRLLAIALDRTTERHADIPRGPRERRSPPFGGRRRRRARS